MPMSFKILPCLAVVGVLLAIIFCLSLKVFLSDSDLLLAGGGLWPLALGAVGLFKKSLFSLGEEERQHQSDPKEKESEQEGSSPRG